jgi:hypothetical protein
MFLAAVTPRTRAIILNSPGNPTGALLSEAEARILAAEAARRGLWIVIDLCYERLIYDGVPHNLPKIFGDAMRDRLVLAGSTSKAYAMTGWRCGWLAAPKPVASAANALQSHETSNCSSITQHAAVAALTGPQTCVTDMLAEYKNRRDQVINWMAMEPRFTCAVPQGAFYVFPDISSSCRPTVYGRRSSLRISCSNRNTSSRPPARRSTRRGSSSVLRGLARKASRRHHATGSIRSPVGRLARGDRSSRRRPSSRRRRRGRTSGRMRRRARRTVRMRCAGDIRRMPSSRRPTRSRSRVLRAVCFDTHTPLVPRGAGTGYTGGAVPVHGGVVISLERLNRILDIDEGNLLAVVEPNVVTGDLQDAVERVGLFYPPDPASLRQSVIGGNVAECAGGPRAFKYVVTRQYVLGLEAVLASGEMIRTGGKVVKNVVGYDLTQLLVGSEGTLAILTKIILRLVPKPPARITLRATFLDVPNAVEAVSRLISARVVPAALELVDAECLAAVSTYLGGRTLAPAGTWRLAADRSGRAARTGCRRSHAGGSGLPRGRRHGSPARGRRGGAERTLVRPAGDLALAQSHHPAQVQSRCRRAQGQGAAAV